jgi:hypothetical protein
VSAPSVPVAGACDHAAAAAVNIEWRGGLGEASATGYCSAIGVPDLASVGDVGERLVRDHRCRVAGVLDASIPRAPELLSRGGIAP